MDRLDDSWYCTYMARKSHTRLERAIRKKSPDAKRNGRLRTRQMTAEDYERAGLTPPPDLR